MYITGDRELEGIYSIKETDHGKGIYATKDIPVNTILMRIKGNQMSFQETKLLGDREAYTIQIDMNKYILTKTPFCYVNHCCDPNSALDGDLFLYTIKPVKAGEQICWDYSTSMFERSWTLKCNCGSPHCRGLIEDFDLLPEEIQRKYISQGIVLPFILKQLRKIV